jgi:hypothetical protein
MWVWLYYSPLLPVLLLAALVFIWFAVRGARGTPRD